MSKQIVKIETMESKNRLRIQFMVGNYRNYICWGQPEMLMTKWKLNDSKKIIPILSV